ncbi:MAG: SOS response-associated peptidase family protein [Bacteroidota bacterium]
MLDRYTITLQSHELTLVLGVEVPDKYTPQYNAAPTKPLPIITNLSTEKLDFHKWGLMNMWTNNKTMSPKFFNLPVDSVINKTTYNKKLRTHRCVIPMDGFYLWKKMAKKQQIPHYFFFPDRKVFCVVGLWEENDDGNCFIMITKQANEYISAFQEDMPAIIDIGSTKKWLESKDLGDLEKLLTKESKEDFLSHTVSPRIKDIDANDVSFINPAPASDQHGNYTLFS